MENQQTDASTGRGVQRMEADGFKKAGLSGRSELAAFFLEDLLLPGTLIAAGVSGLVDVDAVSLALARGAETIGLDEATVGIVIACASNNLFKAGIGVARGAGRFRRDFACALAAMTLAGAAAAALTLHFF